MFSKKVVFVVLAVIAAVLGVLAVKSDATFRATVWSQLFWLTAGTIATTFLLNAILERDLSYRRLNADQFAFRTFTGTVVSSLLDMIKAESAIASQLMISALADNQKFAEATKNASGLIAKAGVIHPELYASHYLDVSTHLRDLANRFIRLFSASDQEMLENYQNLQTLARKWSYRDAFSDSSLAYTNSLPSTDPVRQSREAELSAEIVEVQELLKETAEYLSRLSSRVATKPGMPAIS